MNEHEEAYVVAKTMAESGTVFVRCLGAALYIADQDNRRRIKKAFPELWAAYLKKSAEIET